jgi:hypothetical protein
MKVKTIAAALVASVLTLTLSATPGPARGGSSAALNADKPRATKTLLGPEAEKFAKDLRASNERFRHAQERSEARLTAKGWKRNGVLSVQWGAKSKGSTPLTGRGVIALLMSKLVTPVSAAQDADSDEGYIVTTGWDDGDDSNVEANLFVQLYDGYDSYTSIDIQAVFPTDGSQWYRQWAGGEVGDNDHGTRDAEFESSPLPPVEMRKAAFQNRGGGGSGGAPATGCACVMFRRGGSAGCMLDQALMTSWDVCSSALVFCGRGNWATTWACIETWGYRACGMAFGVGMIRSVNQWFQNCRTQGYF